MLYNLIDSGLASRLLEYIVKVLGSEFTRTLISYFVRQVLLRIGL